MDNKSMLRKCTECKYSCKTDQQALCKFEPKDEFKGHSVHFKDPKNWGKHDQDSRMCVVCKNWFNYKNIKWVRESEGLYPICVEDAKTHAFIVQNTERVKVA